MNLRVIGIVLLAVIVSHSTHGADLLAPGDFIIALDTDILPDSNYPDGPDFFEGPEFAIDSFELTKYLNFGRENSGLIVTPSSPSVVQSMQFWTANDEPPRDPRNFEIYGTNDPITSADNSQGMQENWTLISSGMADLPLDRGVAGPVYSFANSDSYASYRLIFPDTRTTAANSMQIADVYLFTSNDGSGANVLGAADPVLAIDTDPPGFSSAYPALESPAQGIDADVTTKYLNFGKENSGFIVTPAAGSTIIDSFQISTANDVEGRDPASFELYGTNEAIVSMDNEDGLGESWTLIDSGALFLPTDRETPGDVVNVTNSAEYTSYKMVFPTLRDPMGDLVDSMQFSEVQFFGTVIGGVVDGDFNDDDLWNCDDIDALVAAVAGGSTDLSFDMNGDGIIDADDVTDPTDGWLTVGGANNPAATGGNPFLVGDATLDGTVDGLDFIEWNESKFTSTAAWCSGDFTADGTVDGLDFIEWNENKFMSSSDTFAVPEPMAAAASWLLAAWFVSRRFRLKG